MALLIPARQGAREVTPANGRSFTLAELQGIVGGHIEAIPAPDGRILFLNEDGKRLRLPLNSQATVLMAPQLRHDDWIVGDVILCTPLEAGEDEAAP